MILEMLQYQFMQKAFIVGMLVALCTSILGQFLVLKRYSMIGDGLAHVSFAAVGLALALQQSPIIVAIPVVLVASVIMLRAKSIQGDATIGLISAFSVALGVLVASLSNGFNIDLLSYLFGSILAISNQDMYFSIALGVIILLGVIIFYDKLFATTYDEDFAKAIGLRVGFLDLMLAVLTSLTIVIGIRVVGTMLISSMVVFPTVSALQWRKSFLATMMIGATMSVLSVVVGLYMSYVFNLPSGACIVMLSGGYFLISYIGGQLFRK